MNTGMLAWGLAVCACLAAPAVQAASMNVDPVTFTLTEKQATAVLHVTNVDDDSVRVQISPVLWSVDERGSSETPSDGLLLNPPIFQIAPHQTQFVRFGLRQPPGGDVEQAYRLIIEEVPGPAPVTSGGLRTVLRISVPVFVMPRQPREHLAWTRVGSTLTVVNDGNVHQHIISMALSEDSKTAVVLQKSPIYLLATERQEWKLPPTTGALTLTVKTERGEREERLGPSADRP